VPEGNFGRAMPSLRYLFNNLLGYQEKHKEIELNNNKGYFWNVCQNNQPEDFPNSK
jgi:hypothetical protein